MPTIEYTPPGEIDGEPEEVARIAADQLAGIITEHIGPLLVQTGTQVKNAGLQEALTGKFDADEEDTLLGEVGELENLWHTGRPRTAALAGALAQFGEALPTRVRALVYALSRGE